jgi:hypothetical protein
MERGTADGVAIRSDGRIEPGPATSLLYSTGGNYVWSVAADAAGDAYVGMGGTASGGAIVMRVSPDGKATKVFEGKELGVQALRLGTDGKMYAATSPDGKVYRLGATLADAAVVFDPAQTAEKPKYLWDVVQAAGKGDMYVAAGAPAVVYRVPAEGGKPEVALPADGSRRNAVGGQRRQWCYLSVEDDSGGSGRRTVCGVLCAQDGDYGAGNGFYRERVCRGRWNQACARRTSARATPVAGNGSGGSDHHFLAAGVGECGHGKHADP